MPILDGVAATKQIRGLGKVVPIIGLTANADELSHKLARTAGMNDLVMKPVKSFQLKNAIEHALAAVLAKKAQ